MTRYAVDKILWEVAKKPNFGKAFLADPTATIRDYELTETEYKALISKDLRTIFNLGAHPFLLFSFAITKNGGWSMQFMHEYVAELEGLELGDIET